MGRSLSTEPRLEVLPFGRRSRRNRRSPDEVKVCVVTETLMPGERAANVARQHGVSHASVRGGGVGAVPDDLLAAVHNNNARRETFRTMWDVFIDYSAAMAGTEATAISAAISGRQAPHPVPAQVAAATAATSRAPASMAAAMRLRPTPMQAQRIGPSSG